MIDDLNWTVYNNLITVNIEVNFDDVQNDQITTANNQWVYDFPTTKEHHHIWSYPE